MSKYIELTEDFSHADGIYPVTYPPGVYEVVGDRPPGQGEMSPRCAEVALQTRAGFEFDKAAEEKAAAEKAAAEKAVAEKAAAKKRAAKKAPAASAPAEGGAPEGESQGA